MNSVVCKILIRIFYVSKCIAYCGNGEGLPYCMKYLCILYSQEAKRDQIIEIRNTAEGMSTRYGNGGISNQSLDFFLVFF